MRKNIFKFISIGLLFLAINVNAQIPTMKIKFKACDFVKISGGESHFIGIRTNGTLWGCGDNSVCQLGNGKRSSSRKPIQLNKDANWKSIESGWYNSLAIK